jgi:Spy/CpxP family protein refolding chaperone
MPKRSVPARGARLGRAALAFALLAVAQVPLHAADDTVAPDESAPASNPVAHRASRSPVVSRVALMARELDLDARQQAQVKAILEDQRAEVTRIWSDPSVSSAVRIAATQAIGDKTADRIRAALNDEQRKKYIKPRPHDAGVGAPGSDVQKWMKTAQGQGPSSAGAAPAAAKGN